jgi:spore germination protein YaaH
MDTEIVDPNPSSKSKKKSILVTLALLLLLLLVSFFSLYSYLKRLYPTASPFKSLTYIVNAVKNPHAKMAKQTIGFFPYWRMDDIKYIKFDLLSEIIFFSLTADENGNIIKIVGNETDPGWRWWKSETVKNLIAKTQISGGKFSLAIAMQKNDTLEVFLGSDVAQKNLILSVLEIVHESRLDGINLDFEYAGELSDESYRDKFTKFAVDFTSEFRKVSPETELSIDFYPFSVQKPRLFDIAKLSPLFDKVIVMSYDYYGVSSDVAGPVAPMGGYKEDKYYFDVSTTYSDYLTLVPKEKIIMGVPYYGWDYPVEVGDTPMSAVLSQSDENGYTSVMSYGRMRGNADIKAESCKWDDLAQMSWCFYQDLGTGKFHQIWIEDNKSIEVKFNFAKSNDLGGIAIWTLGYDKDYSDLWDLIKSKFTFSAL